MRNLLLFYIVIFHFSFLIFHLPKAYAAEMKSNQYRLETGTYNIGIGNDKLIPDTKVWQKLETTSPMEFEDAGFAVRSGFPYAKTVLPFGFSISNTTFNFGPITRGGPPGLLPSATLTITTAGAVSYQVLASGNQPLKIIKGTTIIDDTNCDNPDDTCTQKIAKPWTDNTKYGFGYSLSGQDIPADFLGSNYFRRFSNEANSEEPVAIMSSVNPGRTSEAMITFKANVPPIQASGDYDNIVTFLAIPGY